MERPSAARSLSIIPSTFSRPIRIYPRDAAEPETDDSTSAETRNLRVLGINDGGGDTFTSIAPSSFVFSIWMTSPSKRTRPSAPPSFLISKASAPSLTGANQALESPGYRNSRGGSFQPSVAITDAAASHTINRTFIFPISYPQNHLIENTKPARRLRVKRPTTAAPSPFSPGT